VVDFTNNLGSTPLLTKEISFLDGQTESEEIILNANPIVNIFVPSGFSGTELRVKIESDQISNNFYDYYKADGGEVMIVVSNKDIIIGISPIDFVNITKCKLVSNIAQSGDIKLIATTRRVG